MALPRVVGAAFPFPLPNLNERLLQQHRWCWMNKYSNFKFDKQSSSYWYLDGASTSGSNVLTVAAVQRSADSVYAVVQCTVEESSFRRTMAYYIVFLFSLNWTQWEHINISNDTNTSEQFDHLTPGSKQPLKLCICHHVQYMICSQFNGSVPAGGTAREIKCSTVQLVLML